MIELYDPSRLGRPRERSLIVPALALAATLLAVGVHAFFAQAGLQALEAQGRELEARLRQVPGSPISPALVNDLRGEAQRLETEVAAARSEADRRAGLSASQWLDRLAALGNADVSLQRVDIEHAGSVRLEGAATSPQALTAFVQAWERQEQLASLRPRSLEVRQDKASPDKPGDKPSDKGAADKAGAYLRFQLRASSSPSPSPLAAVAPAAPAGGRP